MRCRPPLLRHLAHRQHRLRARADVERAQHRGDVVLHRLDREVEVARDQLVGLALQQQRQHVGLARREAERLRAAAWLCTSPASACSRTTRSTLGTVSPSGLSGAGSAAHGHRRHVDAAGHHHVQRLEQRLVAGALGHEAHRAEVDGADHVAAAVGGRHHDHRQRRVLGAELAQHVEAVGVAERAGRAAPGRSRSRPAAPRAPAVALPAPITVTSSPRPWMTPCSADRISGWSSISRTFIASASAMHAERIVAHRRASTTNVGRSVPSSHEAAAAGWPPRFDRVRPRRRRCPAPAPGSTFPGRAVMSSRHGREAFFIVGEGMRQIGSDGRPESVAPSSLQDTTEFRFSRFVPGLRNERENSTNVLAKLAVAMVGGAGRTDPTLPGGLHLPRPVRRPRHDARQGRARPRPAGGHPRPAVAALAHARPRQPVRQGAAGAAAVVRGRRHAPAPRHAAELRVAQGCQAGLRPAALGRPGRRPDAGAGAAPRAHPRRAQRREPGRGAGPRRLHPLPQLRGRRHPGRRDARHPAGGVRSCARHRHAPLPVDAAHRLPAAHGRPGGRRRGVQPGSALLRAPRRARRHHAGGVLRRGLPARPQHDPHGLQLEQALQRRRRAGAGADPLGPPVPPVPLQRHQRHAGADRPAAGLGGRPGRPRVRQQRRRGAAGQLGGRLHPPVRPAPLRPGLHAGARRT